MTNSRKSNIIIIITTAVLLSAVVVFAVLNYENVSRVRYLLERFDDATFLIHANGVEYTVNAETLNEAGITDFTASRRSSGLAAVTVNYQGVPLAVLCEFLGIDLTDMTSCVAMAEDGFFVSIAMDKVHDADNVWIAVMLDGEPLKSRADGGDGPFLLVVRNDTFSMNWCKYLLEITFR
jgi:hypothetical protein